MAVARSLTSRSRLMLSNNANGWSDQVVPDQANYDAPVGVSDENR